jgi:hypothetical protein
MQRDETPVSSVILDDSNYHQRILSGAVGKS